MNPTIDLIKSHRSIRKFTEQAIDESVLQQLLLAGQAAATSSFIQATSVIRVTDSSKRAALVELTGQQKYVGSAPEFLVFCADLYRNQQRVAGEGTDADFAWTEQFIAATVDVALFAQNVVIAAESAALGCCYIGGIRNNPDQVSRLLQLPDLVYPVFGLCLGHPDQNPQSKPRLPQQVAIHQDTYRPLAEVTNYIDAYDRQVSEYYIARTRGKLDSSWSAQMATQAQQQKRPFMQKFLQSKGFLLK
ncbi:MAG: oxygen-insensitive NADPH nitroreductase [Gammaproteobacteria bacterium]|nr:oxygen-insensitive NADPH nitroreductase [Gammaproteobacteria bacterium]